MTWTSKVSSVLRQKASGFVGNAITNAAGNLVNNLAGGTQTKKLAAKIADKSPLDIDDSPTAHLSALNNPFKYGQLYYPEETQNLGEGHYIIFDTIYNQLTSTNALGKDTAAAKLINKSLDVRLGENQAQASANRRRLKQLKSQGFLNENDGLIRPTMSGMGKDNKTHKTLGDSIMLYTPPTVKFDYKANYEQAETKNLRNIQETGGKIIQNIQSFLEGGTVDTEGLLKELAATGGVIGRQILQSSLEVAFPGAAGFFTKNTGRAVNPRMELAFQSVPFRSFNFEFDFAPKNKKEVESINKIMQLFKFHMMPDISDEKFLITPSEFQIMYMYTDKANMYLPKISRCVLTDMSIDYSPDGVFHTFRGDEKGAMPVISKMTLSFTETEIMTKQTTAEGY